MFLARTARNSPTPGFQFAAFTDLEGDALPNSPAVVPWPNQGATNFTGYIVTGTQSPSSPALTVTAMNSYAISGATYSATTGYVTFTVASPNFIVGSEFTVSGSNPSAYNGSYIAVAGTSGTTVVGNPLAAPLGMPQAISDPGAYVSGASMVGVIVPGMAVYGTPSTLQISPFGTFGATGTGGVGTYALTGNPGTFTFVGGTGGVASTTLTVTSAPSTNNQIAVGDTITGTGISANTIITAYQSGTGGTGTYTLNQNATVAASTTITNSGALFTSGSPGTIYAWQAFYNSATATASQSATIGAVTARTQVTVGNRISISRRVQCSSSAILRLGRFPCQRRHVLWAVPVVKRDAEHGGARFSVQEIDRFPEFRDGEQHHHQFALSPERSGHLG